MKRRLKVIQFVPSLNAYDGGTATYMQQLTAVLGQWCDLHVCALTPVCDFVPLLHCTPHSLPLSLWQARAMKRAWLQLLEEVQPDVVHVNCCWMPQIAWVTFWTETWRRKLPAEQRPLLLLTPHGMLEPWLLQRNYWTRKLPAIWLYQRRAVQVCDGLIATAEEEKQHLLDLGWNCQVEVVQNGIDVQGIAMKQVWRAPRRLLFMSRVHPKKGLELLLQAMARLEGAPFELQIAGSGEPAYVEELKKLVYALGLDRQVQLLGPVYGDRKWQLIREADVVVLPTYSENYGLIVAEALAAGTPVLTTTGTPWQSIEKQHCGWWVQPSVEALLEALLEIAKLTAADLEMRGRAARTLAETDCAIEAKVEHLYALYRAKLAH